MSGPMDSAVERVARALVKLDDHPGYEALLMSLRATLLAHDHWEKRAKSFERQVSDLQGRESVAWESRMAALERERAKTKLYRARCPVEASDVDAAGVTREHAEQWLHRLGFHPYECMGHSTLWRNIETEQHACTTSARPGDLAAAIVLLADEDPEHCAHDILVEMADEASS